MVRQAVLIAATVLGPAVWGVFVHLALSRLWPERDSPPGNGPQFRRAPPSIDYQI